MIGLRRGAVNTGTWDDDYGGKVFTRWNAAAIRWASAAGERMKFIEKTELPIYDGTQEYCLWLGCMGAYDPSGREIVLALVKVLRHLKITFGVLRKRSCNGDPARRLGNDLLFSQLAERESRSKGERQDQTALDLPALRPDDEHGLEGIWPDVRDRASQRIAGALPGATASGRVIRRKWCITILATWGVIAGRTMRRVKSCRATPKWWRRRNIVRRSFCCGAGGGMMFLGEEKGERVNMTRAKELVATGATTVGTACPFCQSMFKDALKSVSQDPPKLLDIVQITAASLTD